jgi:hypothetical protein
MIAFRSRAVFWTLAFAAFPLLAAAQEKGMSCEAHAAHAKEAAEPSAAGSDHHAKVDERGDAVMGFDHDRTTHHFRLAADGGAIEVTAKDSGDLESRSAIRGHLAHIAKMFAAGNYQAPMLVHDRVPPGVPVMTARKSKISWKYEELPDGARVSATTRDATALSAVHEFLRFQIEDHRTGDPEKVGPLPNSN